jgi:hypothetical protein
VQGADDDDGEVNTMLKAASGGDSNTLVTKTGTATTTLDSGTFFLPRILLIVRSFVVQPTTWYHTSLCCAGTMIRNDDTVSSVSNTMVINDDASLTGSLSTMKINGSEDEVDSTMKSELRGNF